MLNRHVADYFSSNISSTQKTLFSISRSTFVSDQIANARLCHVFKIKQANGILLTNKNKIPIYSNVFLGFHESEK